MTESLLTRSPAQPEVTGRDLISDRQALVDGMVGAGLISEAFSKSGELDNFSVDETLGRDALQHILIGDKYGGAHHLPTILATGAQNTQISSSIGNPERHKKPAYYRNAQRVGDNGVYRAKTVRIDNGEGGMLEKETGSVFFPDDWSTQKVLEAIIAVSKQEGEHKPDSRAHTHLGQVDGVDMMVSTDDLSGKIVAAMPKGR